MSTQDRLATFLAYKHLNYKDFEKQVGLGQSSASRLSERSTPRTYKRKCVTLWRTVAHCDTVKYWFSM